MNGLSQSGHPKAPGLIERARRCDLDRAGETPFYCRGQGRLDDTHSGKEIRGQIPEVDLTRAKICGLNSPAVDKNATRLRSQTPDAHCLALTRALSAYGHSRKLDARNALHRLGEIGIGELADIFGHERVDNRGRVSLQVTRGTKTPTNACDDNFLDCLVVRIRLGCCRSNAES